MNFPFRFYPAFSIAAYVINSVGAGLSASINLTLVQENSNINKSDPYDCAKKQQTGEEWQSMFAVAFGIGVPGLGINIGTVVTRNHRKFKKVLDGESPFDLRGFSAGLGIGIGMLAIAVSLV